MQRREVVAWVVCFAALGLHYAKTNGIGGVSEGPKTFIVVEESGETDAKIGNFTRGLRNGSVKEYMDSKNHLLLVYDKEAKDQKTGNRVFSEELLADVKPPLLLTYNRAGDKLLKKDPLGSEPTKESFMKVVRANGG